MTSSSSSFFSRVSVELSNAMSDAYGSIMYGDDAGKSAKLVFVAEPAEGKFELGLTFLEVNDRAYVRVVEPDSPAAKAGVQPRDAVQFAAILGSDGAPAGAAFALECEKRGMRTSYDELREMFSGRLAPNTNENGDEVSISMETLEEAIFQTPSPTSKKGKGRVQGMASVVCGSTEHLADPDRLTEFKIQPIPIVMVFRRTRQRQNLAGMSGMGMPSFRLDDECDRASSLIRRLAPSSESATPIGADESIFPDHWTSSLPNSAVTSASQSRTNSPAVMNGTNIHKSSSPLDRDTIEKLEKVKLKMRMSIANQNDVEAATIRGLIPKAVGLAFVRASKVVLGVSVHGGSGIVIARLPDGTWSAPSAIGTFGIGLGIQVGLEVSDFIFVLQTPSSLEHFRRGGNFTIGGKVGAAVAGIGREAYGTASVAGGLCNPQTSPNYVDDASTLNYEDDETVTNNQKVQTIAPFVAFARSQGLYFGVSLEGSQMFTREDINERTYKFSTGEAVNTDAILAGNIPTPPEAEELYASLHNIEFTHEIASLPQPPQVLQNDSKNEWLYKSCSLSKDAEENDIDRFSFVENLTPDVEAQCATFERKFKKIIFGGVSVERLESDNDGTHKAERRTLWLVLPDSGSLRLGYLSKLTDVDALGRKNRFSDERSETDTLGTDGESILTVDTSLASRTYAGRKAQLSNKHSIALTDVTLLSQKLDGPIFQQSNAMEHLCAIIVRDSTGKSIQFLANSRREADILFSGLKLLLEREMNRLGVRGGVPLSELCGKSIPGAITPEQARGETNKSSRGNSRPIARIRPRKGVASRGISNPSDIDAGYASSDVENDEDSLFTRDSSVYLKDRHKVPEGRKSWSQVPARSFLRDQASGAPEVKSPAKLNVKPSSTFIPKTIPPPEKKDDIQPIYAHGELLIRDISTDVMLPLPLPLSRVLLLDSSSPVITKWEADRGDVKFVKGGWEFPANSPRGLEIHATERQLIASGSMMGAHRKTSYDRMRSGQIVHLEETQIVDSDDLEKLSYTVTERMPRRGFAIKIRIILRSTEDGLSSATVRGEIRPMGKNMTDQSAVHRAFNLVLNESRLRYGEEKKGLLAGFLNVVHSIPAPEAPPKGSPKGLPTPPVKSKKTKKPSPIQPSSSEQKVDAPDSDHFFADFSNFDSPLNRQTVTEVVLEPLGSDEWDTEVQRSRLNKERTTHASMKKAADLLRDSDETGKPMYTPFQGRNSRYLPPPSPKGGVGVDNKESVANEIKRKSNEIKEKWRDRPPTPSLDILDKSYFDKKPITPSRGTSEFAPMPGGEVEDDDAHSDKKAVMIEVKPLPKIRLSLMPAPREEDEEQSGSNASPMQSSPRISNGKTRRNRR